LINKNERRNEQLNKKKSKCIRNRSSKEKRRKTTIRAGIESR